MRLKSAAALALAALLTAGAAQAEIVRFTGTLSGGEEVPPNTSAGTGTFSAEVETAQKVLVYRATYSGLTGPATAAHFHGPAAKGENAPPVVTIPNPEVPVSGTAILTREQVDDLVAGKWYLNVHTAAHPGGEVRGQLKREP